MRTRKSILLIALLSFFVAVFSACGTTNTDNVSTNTKKTEAPKVEKPVYKIFNNVEESKTSFNNAASKLNIGFSLNNLDVKEGEVQNTAQCMLNDHIIILELINKKDNTVREISMIAQGDGTDQSTANILLVIGTLISTVEPNINNEDRIQLIKDLGIPGEIKDGFQRKKIHNNFKYTITMSSKVGLMFSIGNAQDN